MCSRNTDKFYLVNLAYLWSFCSLGEFFYKISCKTFGVFNKTHYLCYVFKKHRQQTGKNKTIMKAIYAKDIKAMVKKFNLTEDESEYLNDIAEAINKERTEICEEIQMTLLYGSWAQARNNAIRALLVYFGAKTQKENDLRMKLDRTTWEIAKVLKCGSYQVMQWLKGIAIHKDRFGKFVECSDTFGLNYLEIA